MDVKKIDLSYLKNVLAPKLTKKGVNILEIRDIDYTDLKNYPSGWAKKLSYGRDRTYYYLRVRVD